MKKLELGKKKLDQEIQSWNCKKKTELTMKKLESVKKKLGIGRRKKKLKKLIGTRKSWNWNTEKLEKKKKR